MAYCPKCDIYFNGWEGHVCPFTQSDTSTGAGPMIIMVDGVESTSAVDADVLELKQHLLAMLEAYDRHLEIAKPTLDVIRRAAEGGG